MLNDGDEWYDIAIEELFGDDDDRNARRIPLNGKHGVGRFALVDEEDYWALKDIPWHAREVPESRTFYACSIGADQNSRYMHRMIMKPRPKEPVDHVNCNGLDNRRCNLRLAGDGKNTRNRGHVQERNKSGYAGIRRAIKASVEKWEAHITLEGRHYYLGSFPSKLKAAEVRRAAEILLFGEFAPRLTEHLDRLVGKYRSISELKVGERETNAQCGLRCIHFTPWNTWQVVVRKVTLGSFKEAIDAIAARDAFEAQNGFLAGHLHAQS